VPRLALAHRQPDVAEVVDGAEDRGPAYLQLRGEFVGGQSATVGGQQGDEHQRRQRLA